MGLYFDLVNWAILKRLQEDARISFRQLGEAIGLTPPAIADRVRRLEDQGAITGYTAQIDLVRVGLHIQAFVHLTCNAQQSERFKEVVDSITEIIECHCVTGVESYILKVALPSVPHLESLLWKLKDYGEVRTSVVLSSQISHRPILRDMVQRDL